MRIALLILGLATFLAPMVCALVAGPGDQADRVGVWLLTQPVTILFFVLAWWLRRREIATWPRHEGTIVGVEQTGMYEHGVLALRLKLEHTAGGVTTRAVTKVRVPVLEAQRYSVGTKVSLAVSPRDRRQVRVV
jgi:hypothetical protein